MRERGVGLTARQPPGSRKEGQEGEGHSGWEEPEVGDRPESPKGGKAERGRSKGM